MALLDWIGKNRVLTAIIVLLLLNSVFSVFIFFDLQDSKKAFQSQLISLNEKFDSKTSLLAEKDSNLSKNLASKSKELANYVNYKSDNLSKQLSASESKLSALISEIEKQSNMNLRNLQKELQGVSEQVSIVSPDFAAISSNAIQSIVTVRSGNKLGSGAILSSDGFIVTNYHVIEGVSAVSVDKSTGGTFNATIVQSNRTDDLAILKIESSSLPFLQLGDSTQVKVGQKVIALGNPSGLTATVTEGIVSAVNRNIEELGNNLIQTDVSINPGNSGGPLIDGNGKIIGINEAKVANTEGLGFAIPSNKVKTLFEQAKANG